MGHGRRTVRRERRSGDVVLFMKARRRPQCGFSSQMVRFLTLGSCKSLNVRLGRTAGWHQDLWPTIPQLYVKGEFVGGYIGEMFQADDFSNFSSRLSVLQPAD
jgi:glutaredoxin-related protein